MASDVELVGISPRPMFVIVNVRRGAFADEPLFATRPGYHLANKKWLRHEPLQRDARERMAHIEFLHETPRFVPMLSVILASLAKCGAFLGIQLDQTLHNMTESKIAAEQFLRSGGEVSRCAPIVFRFATLFGLSPRTRFDLIINQFTLEAIEKRKLIIYQKNYNRSFVHIRDVIRAIMLVLETDEQKVRNQIFNVGSNSGNYSKEEIIRLVQKYVSGLEIQYKDLTFGGDMRDIRVSFDKINRVLGYTTKYTVEDGIRELAEAIQSGFLADPNGARHRNAKFIVQ